MQKYINKAIKSLPILILLYIITLFVIAYIAYELKKDDIRNDCMIQYIRSNKPTASIYKFPTGWHIESGYNEAIKQYKVGTANGCVMRSNNLMADISNTVYCNTVKTMESL